MKEIASVISDQVLTESDSIFERKSGAVGCEYTLLPCCCEVSLPFNVVRNL